MKEITNNNMLFKDPDTGQWVPIPAIVTGGATAEQAAQIEQNTADISQLSEEIANLGTVAGNIPSNTETFTFTLEDGTEVVKEVYVKT